MQICLQDAADVVILVQNHVAHSHAVQSLAVLNHVHAQNLAVLNHVVQNHAVLNLAAQHLAHALNHVAKLAVNQYAVAEIDAVHAADATVMETVTMMRTVKMVQEMVVT